MTLNNISVVLSIKVHGYVCFNDFVLLTSYISICILEYYTQPCQSFK